MECRPNAVKLLDFYSRAAPRQDRRAIDVKTDAFPAAGEQAACRAVNILSGN